MSLTWTAHTRNDWIIDDHFGRFGRSSAPLVDESTRVIPFTTRIYCIYIHEYIYNIIQWRNTKKRATNTHIYIKIKIVLNDWRNTVGASGVVPSGPHVMILIVECASGESKLLKLRLDIIIILTKNRELFISSAWRRTCQLASERRR